MRNLRNEPETLPGCPRVQDVRNEPKALAACPRVRIVQNEPEALAARLCGMYETNPRNWQVANRLPAWMPSCLRKAKGTRILWSKANSG